MRKILRILSFCLVLGVVLSTQSFAISYFDSIIETEIITDKMIFAAEMDAVYAKNLAKGNIESKSIEEIELLQYKYILADDEDKEAIKEELAMAGVYIYISENDVEKQEISLLASDSSDVELDKPVVSYLSFEQTC